jgi:hypothetical protein
MDPKTCHHPRKKEEKEEKKKEIRERKIACFVV